MSLRVIAGSARGRRLLAPRGAKTRPTADRVKENLFNILQPYTQGARFLDLFGGSGAIGIEALSRGAREAVFVERDPDTASVIRDNLKHTNLSESAVIMTMTAERAIRKLRESVFDIIFMDPPYAGGLLSETFTLLERTPLLNGEGFLAAELPARAENPVSETYEMFRTKIYGNVKLVLYTHAR